MSQCFNLYIMISLHLGCIKHGQKCVRKIGLYLLWAYTLFVVICQCTVRIMHVKRMHFSVYTFTSLHPSIFDMVQSHYAHACVFFTSTALSHKTCRLRRLHLSALVFDKKTHFHVVRSKPSIACSCTSLCSHILHAMKPALSSPSDQSLPVAASLMHLFLSFVAAEFQFWLQRRAAGSQCAVHAE